MVDTGVSKKGAILARERNDMNKRLNVCINVFIIMMQTGVTGTGHDTKEGYGGVLLR